jgi:hypothetical protein
VLRLVFHGELPLLERAVERVLEELPQVRDRQYAFRGLTFVHGEHLLKACLTNALPPLDSAQMPLVTQALLLERR